MTRTSPADMDVKAHWEQRYATRAVDQVSWYQAQPSVSLRLIEQTGLRLEARLIGVGGGASTLAAYLLERGYRHLTVLDVSGAALQAAQARLGARAARVTWQQADIREVELPAATYDLWHDRALLHFLTDPADQQRYVRLLARALRPDGHVILAAFAPEGPPRCSGLEVQRYDTVRLQGLLGPAFHLRETVRETHLAPGGVAQAFMYAWLQRGEA